MIIERCEKTNRYTAYQNLQGHPCLAEGETWQEAKKECEYLIGQVQVRVGFERRGLREVENDHIQRVDYHTRP